MTLVKTSLLNGIAVGIKMLTMLGISKILAVYVGPAGYAALGQFQNAVQMITTLASGAINTGVTKYTAEYYEDEELQKKLWRTAGTISLTGSIIIGMAVALLSTPLAKLFLKNDSYSSIFSWLGITLVFFVFNTLLLAIVNGKKELAVYIKINIIGSLVSLATSSLMIINYGLYGALLALAINQSLVFFVTLVFCLRTPWFHLKNIIGLIDKTSATNLLKYTAMAITSAATVPLTHILIRDHLGKTLGWDVAGYWDAMWRISAVYLMFVTTTLSVYYLPRLSELKTGREIKKEILRGYKIIFPIAIIFGITILITKDFIIKLLFTPEFLPMRNLFLWQIIGDTLKIGSWLLGYVLTARAYTIEFVLSEIFFSALFFGLVVLFSNFAGLESTSLAHATNYLLHFIAMFYLLKRRGVFT